jgi:hypothetical protein
VVPTVTSSIRHPDGVMLRGAAIGDGPVDAVFKAVGRVVGMAADLREFAVVGVTPNKDAQDEVSVELEFESDEIVRQGLHRSPPSQRSPVQIVCQPEMNRSSLDYSDLRQQGGLRSRLT